jgi:ABC-2 type transport system ATP-binding protein
MRANGLLFTCRGANTKEEAMSQHQRNGLMVEAANLSKHYKRPGGEPIVAVENVDIHIRKGEIFSLLGPNGAGKTTTISMMCGLLTPTNGDATIGGYSITKQPLRAKALLGVIPQNIALYEALSARQNLEFFGKLQGKRGAELTRLIDEAIDFVDLRERQNDKIQTFSGGMQRRVNIAVGLLHQPQLLFMDEPTVGIDPQNRRRVLDMVLRLRDEMKITVLYTSHLMEEVQELSDRVAIMDHGRVIALGTVDELIQSVGEEDRLVLNVGTQLISEPLLNALRAAVESTTSVTFERGTATSDADKEAPQITDSKLVILAKRGRRALPHLLNTLNEADIEVQSIGIHEPDLEAVFLNLTGRALRD